MDTRKALLHSTIYTTFDGGDLSEICHRFLAEQRETWPDFRRAHASLAGLRVRDLACTGFSVLLQHNPGRAASTLAPVGEEEIGKRPCFLCSPNLPEAQKAILYRGAFLILCNPMPVFESHLTAAHVDHRPQEILGNMDMFLNLMADLGRRWLVLYNGPRCGASAPDHLHFQAVPAGRTPVEKEIMEEDRLVPITKQDGVVLYDVQGLGRKVVMLAGHDPYSMEAALTGYIDTLGKDAPGGEEPMLNMAGFQKDGEWRVLVFPRKKHRPDAFFREGDAQVAVSPAVIEMAGVIVTPRVRDFEGLEAPAIEDIYAQVSLSAAPVSEL